jgi:predicted nuclease of restriction endonuclease-like RecB superfamily
MKYYAKGHNKKGKMNQTEAEFAAFLERGKQAGEILWYTFEGIRLRLADNTFYVPDFQALHKDLSLVIYEVKGFWTEKARVKIKVAADKFPFIFIAAMKVPKKNGGGWKFEEFGEGK